MDSKHSQAWTPKLEFVAEVNHIFRVPPKVPNLDLCKVAASRAETLVQGPLELDHARPYPNHSRLKRSVGHKNDDWRTLPYSSGDVTREPANNTVKLLQ